MIRKVALIICVATSLSTLTSLSTAQTTTATLSGILTDESGAVIPAAEVVIANAATGVRRKVVADELGRFAAPQLAPGPYELAVTAAGFETLIRKGITLAVGQEAFLTLPMKLGAVTEQVTVTGEVPLVNTSGSSVSGVVEEKRIQDLPLNGRDFTQLALVQPGVIPARNTDSIAQKGFGVRISMAGSRPDQQSWLLDGTDIKSMSNFGTPGSVSGLMLGVDAVREFQVLTSNYSAEFGGTSGGVINLVTKSGTNELHGTAYEFLRNSALDARNFFDPGKIPAFKRNQFGFSLGGPIKKDGTFFFGNYEGLRQRLGVTNNGVVPDENVHKGLIPAAAGGLQQVQVSPVIRPYLDLWPLPNGPAVGGVSSGLAQLSSSGASPTTEDYFMARVDHRISDSKTIFSRFTFDQGDNSIPSFLSVTNLFDATRSRYATVKFDYIITPQFLSSSAVAYNRTNLFGNDTINISYPKNLFLPWEQRYPPILSYPGVTTFGPTSDRDLFSNVQNLYQFTQSFVYTHGGHSWKFGFNLEKIDLNTDGGPRDNGVFSWNSVQAFLTNGPLLTFTTGVPGSTSQRSFRQLFLGPYVADDWKIRPNFTLNLGLRYEPFTVPSEKWDRISIVKDWVTGTQFDTNVPFWNNPTLKNLAPRVGFAWDPKANGKTAVRGGFGLFYVALRGDYYRTTGVVNLPFAARIEAPIGSRIFSTAVSDVLAVGPTLFTTQITPATLTQIVDPNVKSSYEMKFNLSAEHELPGNVSVTAGYIGGRGVRLWRVTDINASPPTSVNGRPFVVAGTPVVNPKMGVGSINYSDAQSFYNGLQVEVKKRFSHRFQLQTAFTWSKAVDDSTTGKTQTDFKEGGTSQPYNPKADRGLSPLNLGRNLVVNGIYSFPSLQKSRFVSYFLGGWQTSGILSVSDGVPFSATVSGRNAPDQSRTANLQRPDLLAGRSPKDAIQGDPNQYFDPSIFVLPPAGFYGNAGRNILIGPGFSTFDFSMAKSTPLGQAEKTRLEFRADFFNLFNRANFAPPDFIQVFNASTRARIASAGRIGRTVSTARQLQFSLKLAF